MQVGLVHILHFLNLTIYNSGVTMESWLNGYYSEYGATIYCYNSSDCTIACNGNACVNLDFICDSTSTCNYASYGVQSYNDDGNQPEYYRGLRVITPVSETSLNTEAQTRLCDTYIGDCAYTAISASESNYSILCNGYAACVDSTIELTSSTNNSGIYCSALQSCLYGNVIANEGSTNTTLYCGSHFSCSTTVIRGFEKIYSLGLQGLDSSVIYSDNNVINEMNLYLGAYSAAGDALTIYCNYSDTCNVFCDAYQACSGVHVGSCPSVIDCTGTPTSHPLPMPTELPSKYPTSTIIMTTPWSEQSTSVITTAHLDNGEDTSEQDLVKVTLAWEAASYVCAGLSLIAPCILSVIVFIFHKQRRFYGCDKPNHLAIFAFFWNLGDFYSDIIFTFVLIFQRNELWYFAAAFLLVPYVISTIIYSNTLINGAIQRFILAIIWKDLMHF